MASAQLPWSQILTQAAATLDAVGGRPPAEVLALKPSFAVVDPPPDRAAGARSPAEVARTEAGDARPARPDPAAEVEGVSDWMGTLDIIDGMAGLAEDQKRRQRAQSASHQAALDDLRRDVQRIRESLRTAEARALEARTSAETRLQRVRAEADAQVQEIRAEAEARVRTIRAEAEASRNRADERVRVADLRAATAERWLQRIDAAAKTLLLGGRADPDRAGV